MASGWPGKGHETLLKNSFALSSAPVRGLNTPFCSVSALFWALLDRRPDRRLLLQQAGKFSEIYIQHSARSAW